MEKNKFNFILLFLATIVISSEYTFAQKVLTLEQCYDAAYSKNALASEKALQAEISSLKEINLSKGWMPSLDLNGTALYNSDVVDLGPVLGNLPFPGTADLIRPLPHDQYKITVDINQVVYDGGAIRGAREMERSELRVSQKQTEADIYRLKQQVNTYFFNLRLLERQRELLGLYTGLVEKRMSSVTSAVENGVMLRSETDVLESELLNLRQQLSENEIRAASLRKVLTDLTGFEIDEGTVLSIPDLPQQDDNELTRPELELFDLNIAQLNAGESILTSRRMPKAFGFATLGYGNPPGSNFFMDKFDTFYIIGAGIKWNITDWNKSKNEKQVISLRKNIIENRKKDLSDNLLRQLELKKAEIENLENLIVSDSLQVSLRKKITASAESQFRNGTITATEYLNILTSERQALVNSEIHRISLSLAKVEYINISGKDLN